MKSGRLKRTVLMSEQTRATQRIHIIDILITKARLKCKYFMNTFSDKYIFIYQFKRYTR